MLLTACSYILGLEIHKTTKKELKVMQQRVNKTSKVEQKYIPEARQKVSSFATA
jgi:hypothetical protein